MTDHERSHALLKSSQLTGATAAASERRGECTLPYREDFSSHFLWCRLVGLGSYSVECILAACLAAALAAMQCELFR